MGILKKYSLILTALLLLTSFTSVKENELIGKWKGVDKGDIGYLTITDEGYAQFELDGAFLGGKSFEMQGRNACMKYIVNKEEHPAEIDFIIYDNSSKAEIFRLKGIYELNSIDELHLAIAFEGPKRPIDFSKDDVILKRMK